MKCQQYFSEIQHVEDNYATKGTKLNRQKSRQFYFDARFKHIYYKDNKLAVDMDIKIK